MSQTIREPSINSNQIKLRKSEPKDAAFLFELYRCNRKEFDFVSKLSDEHKQSLLQMQFTMREQSYQNQFPKAEDNIILLSEDRIGRLLINLDENSFHLIDIALLPERQRKGIGQLLLAEFINRAKATRVPFRLRVDLTNPAQKLYARNGFQIIEEKNGYFLMERRPD